MTKKIRIADVARLTKKSDRFIREAIKAGYLDFGIAMQTEGSSKWSFMISVPKFAEYLGVSVDELWDMVDGLKKGA